MNTNNLKKLIAIFCTCLAIGNTYGMKRSKSYSGLINKYVQAEYEEVRSNLNELLANFKPCPLFLAGNLHVSQDQYLVMGAGFGGCGKDVANGCLLILEAFTNHADINGPMGIKALQTAIKMNRRDSTLLLLSLMGKNAKMAAKKEIALWILTNYIQLDPVVSYILTQ